MNLYKDGDICNLGDIFHDCDQTDWCFYNDYILGIVRERDLQREVVEEINLWRVTSNRSNKFPHSIHP